MIPIPAGFFFFFNDTATTEIYTLSLHDALPISAALPRPLTESRKQLVRALAGELSRTLPSRRFPCAEHQVLAHAERREDAAPLGNQADAEPRNSIGGAAFDRSAVEADPAGARRREADHRANQRRLPGAVAAEERHRLAGSNVQRHPVQDVAVAVIRVDVRDLEHRQRSSSVPR